MNLLKTFGLNRMSKKKKKNPLTKKSFQKNKRVVKKDKRTEILVQQQYQSFGSSHLSVEEDNSIIVHDRFDLEGFGKSDYFSLPAYESAVNLAIKYCCGDDAKWGNAYEEIASSGETSTGADDLALFDSNESTEAEANMPTRNMRTFNGESTKAIIPQFYRSCDEDVKNADRLYSQIILRRVNEKLEHHNEVVKKSVRDSETPPEPHPMYISDPSNSESDDDSEETRDYSSFDDKLGPYSGSPNGKTNNSEIKKRAHRNALLLFQSKNESGTIGISTTVFSSLDSSDANKITESSKYNSEAKRLVQIERQKQKECEQEKKYRAMHEKLKNVRNQQEPNIQQCSGSPSNTKLYDLLVKGNCVVCKKRSRTHLAVPCMHYSFCETCSLELTQKSKQVTCPVCNKEGILFSKLKY